MKREQIILRANQYVEHSSALYRLDTFHRLCETIIPQAGESVSPPPTVLPTAV